MRKMYTDGGINQLIDAKLQPIERIPTHDESDDGKFLKCYHDGTDIGWKEIELPSTTVIDFANPINVTETSTIVQDGGYYTIVATSSLNSFNIEVGQEVSCFAIKLTASYINATFDFDFGSDVGIHNMYTRYNIGESSSFVDVNSGVYSTVTLTNDSDYEYSALITFNKGVATITQKQLAE